VSWQLRSQRAKALPFLKDWEAGKIQVVGGWSSDVGMSKASLAFLNTELVPETRLLSPGAAALGAKAIGAGELCEQKDLWVLKGAMSFAGRSLIRGVDFSAPKWEAAVLNTLRETEAGRPWVAQRRIEIPSFGGAPTCEFGLYFINGKPSGYLCRTGHSGFINDTSTEKLRPVLIDTRFF
jgi:hypothetical protein